MKKFIAFFVVMSIVLLMLPDMMGFRGASLSLYGLAVLALSGVSMAGVIWKGRGQRKEAMWLFAAAFVVYFLFGMVFNMAVPAVYGLFAIILWNMATKELHKEIEDFCQE